MQDFLTSATAGGGLVAFAKTIVAPIERVKLLFQVQDALKTITADKRYNGIVRTLRRVYREQGESSL